MHMEKNFIGQEYGIFFNHKICMNDYANADGNIIEREAQSRAV